MDFEINPPGWQLTKEEHDILSSTEKKFKRKINPERHCIGDCYSLVQNVEEESIHRGIELRIAENLEQGHCCGYLILPASLVGTDIEKTDPSFWNERFFHISNFNRVRVLGSGEEKSLELGFCCNEEDMGESWAQDPRNGFCRSPKFVRQLLLLLVYIFLSPRQDEEFIETVKKTAFHILTEDAQFAITRILFTVDEMQQKLCSDAASS